MKRWRSGITTTIVLTVVVAVVLGVSLQHVVDSGLVYLGLARQQTFDSQNPQLLRQLPGRIAALIDVVQASPDEARPAILGAAQQRLLQVRLLDGPMPNLIRGDVAEAADAVMRRVMEVRRHTNSAPRSPARHRRSAKRAKAEALMNDAGATLGERAAARATLDRME